MKIIQYCQHVLGIGHLVRTLEVLKHLSGHDVIFVNGGAPTALPLPAHVREVRQPALMMDPEFKGLVPIDPAMSLADIKMQRKQRLMKLIAQEKPDVMLIELFPFGRRAFAFELLPALAAIANGELPSTAVFCSLRDILVESKKHWDEYEKEVVQRLNTHFQAVLVHSDPALIRLDETFGRTADIDIPLVYSGFVAQKPTATPRGELKRQLGMGGNDKVIVASAGGGRVGEQLLSAAVDAVAALPPSFNARLKVFAGPHMPERDYARLQRRLPGNASIERFSPDFLTHMAAADLSISMAGYNTCMNILATRTPALVWPFSQNREQHLRARRLADTGAVSILRDSDLQASVLAGLIRDKIDSVFPPNIPVDLEGAAFTAAWIEQYGADAKVHHARRP